MIRALRRLGGTGLFAIVVGIVVIVVLVFLVTTGGFDLGSDDDEGGVLGATEEPAERDEVEPDGEGPSDETSSAGAPVLGVRQDEAFDFGDLRLAVTDIRLSDNVSEGRDSVEAIDRFATVRLTVRNTGNAPLSLDGSLLLLDGRGRRFGPDAAATAAVALRDEGRWDALATTLQPGLESELVVVFQVPDDAEDFRLRVLGGYVDVVLER